MPAMMLFNLRFDRHEPDGAMRFGRDTIWASRFHRGF
jgi:hypothetical protein